MNTSGMVAHNYSLNEEVEKEVEKIIMSLAIIAFPISIEIVSSAFGRKPQATSYRFGQLLNHFIF